MRSAAIIAKSPGRVREYALLLLLAILWGASYTSIGVTAQSYLRVPVGLAIAVVFLGESPSPGSLVGLICVVAGVAAMLAPKRSIHGRAQ